MALAQLSLENLKKLDLGKAEAAFALALQNIAKDLEDRPGDDRARKIVFTWSFKPVTEVQGNSIFCDGAKLQFQIKTNVPAMETNTVDLGIKKGGILYFSEESPTNHRQAVLGFDGDGDGEADNCGK